MSDIEQDRRWVESHKAAAIEAFENGHWHVLKCQMRMIERIEKRIESYAEV